MKKTGLVLLAIVLTVFLAAGVSHAAIRTVCASGCGYTTIQAAVNASSNGDTIIVKPGGYQGNIIVTKSVQILGGTTGQGKLKTFVSAVNPGNWGFRVEASNVLISGFTIGGATSSYGIMILGNNVRVRYCTVEKCAWGIVVVYPASNVRLAYNQIRYNTAMSGFGAAGTGLWVYGSNVSIPNVYINYNQINDNDAYGVYVYGNGGPLDVSGMQIQYNTLVNNGSFDLTPPSNNNFSGFYFRNASGNVTMNYNNIRETVLEEISWDGPAYPTFSGTGNLIFPNNRQSLVGPSKPLTLP